MGVRERACVCEYQAMTNISNSQKTAPLNQTKAFKVYKYTQYNSSTATQRAMAECEVGLGLT